MTAVVNDPNFSGTPEAVNSGTISTTVPATSTNFYKIITDTGSGVSIWFSKSQTSPAGTLSGTEGDICLNATAGKIAYCTGTTNWQIVTSA